MDLKNFKRALVASVSDVEFIADQRKKLGDKKFQEKMYSTLRKYIDNEKNIFLQFKVTRILGKFRCFGN